MSTLSALLSALLAVAPATTADDAATPTPTPEPPPPCSTVPADAGPPATGVSASAAPGNASPGIPATGDKVYGDGVFGGPELVPAEAIVVADAAPELPEFATEAWLVADADSGDVLAACNAHLAMRPASTLKLLTAITLLPGLDPDLAYTATDADALVEGSRVGLRPEETYSFDDLVHGLMLASGNDAAHAIAELTGGMADAITAMNAEADRLGAVDTVARTPHGLDEPGQVSTAYDLALIGRAALADPDLATLMATETYEFPGLEEETFQIQNRNRILGDYDGALGLKTGYTSMAGHTIVAAAERNGVALIVTVLKPHRGRAEPIAEALLDWGFAANGTAAPVGTLVTPEEVEHHRAVAAPTGDEAKPTPNTAVDPSATLGAAAQTEPARHNGVGAAELVPAAAAITVVLAAFALWRRRRRTGRYSQ